MKLNSRERILTALNHQEPDKVPFDLAGSTWTGITNGAYQNLRLFLGKEKEEPNWSDVIQQIVIPSDEILEILEVDTRGLFPLTSHNWNVYDSNLPIQVITGNTMMNGVLHIIFRKRAGTGSHL